LLWIDSQSGEGICRRPLYRERGKIRWPAHVSLVMLALLVEVSGNAAADDRGALPPVSMRRLYGDELRAARNARNEADRRRAAYEEQYRTPVRKSVTEEAAFKEVVSAYLKVINIYEGTQFEAYASMRLAGAYQYRGETAKSIEQLSIVPRKFPGTKDASDAILSLASVHASLLNDPAGAVEWLKRIPAPPGAGEDGVVPPDKYDERHVQYISAQISLAEAEAKLGHMESARERFEELARRYPQHRSYFEGVQPVHLRPSQKDTVRDEAVRLLEEASPVETSAVEAEPTRVAERSAAPQETGDEGSPSCIPLLWPIMAAAVIALGVLVWYTRRRTARGNRNALPGSVDTTEKEESDERE